MSRKLMALLVSGTIALAPLSTSAWSAPGSSAPAETKNAPPLAPAGPAGIREAQGSGGNEAWIIGGFIAVFALLWIIDSGNDDNGVPAITGTN